MAITESDLAAPVTAYLAALGWTVRSEVKDCDVAAVRGDDLLVVELKKALTLALLVQAVRRQRLTDSVYLAVPRPGLGVAVAPGQPGCSAPAARLELGLLFVSLAADRDPVEVVLQPRPLAPGGRVYRTNGHQLRLPSSFTVVSMQIFFSISKVSNTSSGIFAISNPPLLHKPRTRIGQRSTVNPLLPYR